MNDDENVCFDPPLPLQFLVFIINLEIPDSIFQEEQHLDEDDDEDKFKKLVFGIRR